MPTSGRISPLSSRLPFRSKQLAVAMTVAVPIGITALVVALAAGTYVSAELENGALSGGAKVVASSGASGGKAVQFGTGSTPTPTPTTAPTPTPTPTPAPPPSGFPSATNTGYQNAPGYPGSLHACSTPIQSNTTYNFCDFPGGADIGSSSTAVTNVTFNGCNFHGNEVQNALVTLYGDNITFNYSSFTPALSAPPATATQNYQYGLIADGGYNTHVAQLTVTHSNFWGFGNAIDVTGSTQAKPQVYRDNYIHDACVLNDTCPTASQNYHTDGIGDLNSGDHDSYVTIDNNTISSDGNTNAIAYQEGPYDHFTVTNNYFSGFGFTVHIGANGPTNSTFTGNVFGSDFNPYWGALYGGQWASSTNTWSGNTVHYVPGTTTYLFYNGGSSSSGLITPANNGWFWTSKNTIAKTDS